MSGASCTKRLLLGALLAGACWLGAAGQAGAQSQPADGTEDAPSLRGTPGGASGAGTAASDQPAPWSRAATLLPLFLLGVAAAGGAVVLVRRAATVPMGVDGRLLDPAPIPVADAHANVAGELGLDETPAGQERRSRKRPQATRAGDDVPAPEARSRPSAGLVDLSGIEGVLGPRPPADRADPASGAPPDPAASRPAVDRVGTADDRAGPERGPTPAVVTVDVSEPLFPDAPGTGEPHVPEAGAPRADAGVTLSAGELRWTRQPGAAAGINPTEPAAPVERDADPASGRRAHHPAS